MPKDKKTLKPAAASRNEEGLVVTAQQSRFHVDASDASESKEIDVKDLSITIGGREVISHADLKLQENMHYVLVGRNGSGKSTLLKALGEGRVPGVSWNLNILLLGQTNMTTENIDERFAGMKFQSVEGSVLDNVIRSDVRRERALREAQILSAALDNSLDPVSVVRAVRSLKHQRLGRSLAEMREIASRRSGARGSKARKDLIALEELYAASQSMLEQQDGEIDPATLQTETHAAVDMLTDIQASLEAMDASSAEARARTVLLGLGFPEPTLDKPFTTLSGGWRTRCVLACTLFQHPDILMLDEPTNFLDLPAVIWLQAHIQSLESTTVVIVTHDREFADTVAEELLVLREKRLERFKGNLSAWEQERRERTRYLTKMKDAQERKTRHMEETIEQNVRAARRTGDDKKLRQAASRRKKIDERTGLEVGIRGGRFKLNRDLAGYHYSMRDEIDIPQADPLVRMALPTTPPDLRFPGALVSAEKVSYTHPGKKPTEPVLRDIDLVIHPGERVGLAGLNGSGKSTLVSLLVGGDGGSISTLMPTRGSIVRHPRARIKCFSQHAVEELETQGAVDKNATALSELLAVAGGEMNEQDARKVLGSLGLQGQVASDTPVVSLSGGQKVRLVLAKLVWSVPHLLVLDEVTTHLDSDTVLALIEGLKAFEGALLVVTHDRFFMRCVVEGHSPYQRTAEEADDSESESEEEGKSHWRPRPGFVYRLIKGKLERLEGGMRRYEEIASKRAAKLLKS